uniref:RBR-type E3 ubiquitin transferase n=1 Tax=Trichobilharzia regenti TaxID=157069 RepID=A0AA85KQJ2_TRIRE|nr:unnamed protein product [Trichobilharzia regenti]CAH8852826.1 unnamed protein product [Trichobilharzia regenti]
MSCVDNDANNNDNNNDEIQSLEIEFLSSMFDGTPNSAIFNYDKLSRHGSFTFHPHFNKPIEMYGPVTRIKLRNTSTVEPSTSSEGDKTCCCYLLHYLPALIMTFNLPLNYPGDIPGVCIPEFSLSSIWLPISILNELKERLIEIANQNLGEMTLLSCIEFLQNESFDYLMKQAGESCQQKQTFNLFNFYNEYSCKDDISLPLQDCCDLLLSINEDRLDIDYDEAFIECPVCFEIKKGSEFIRFMKCKCSICRDCTLECFKISIRESLFNGALSCLKCNEEVSHSEVRYILPEDLHDRYENLILKRGLDFMPDVVACPRQQCEYPVILDSDSLGRCPRCELSFCPMCLKTYHGVEPCKNRLRSIHNAFMSAADREAKLRQIKEEEESEKLITDNYKKCPGCWTPCEKVTGCNKMTCSYCHLFFCWICLEVIYDRQNPYSHFSKGDCQGQLWREDAIIEFAE